MRMSALLCFTGLVVLSSCGETGGRTAAGLQYAAAPGAHGLPWNVETQLDAALARVVGVAAVCDVPLTPARRRQLTDALFITIFDGPIIWSGNRYDGLSFADGSIHLATLDNRVPAAAHELWHHVLAVSVGGPARLLDATHTGPCWDRVNGDTRP